VLTALPHLHLHREIWSAFRVSVIPSGNDRGQAFNACSCP